jgi:dihydrolipoamide dehydrogenase
MKIKKFDVIVIGAGSGLTISSRAESKGLKVAIVEKSSFGGTCLNRGCIPSKMLIHSADVIETINKAHEFGVNAKIVKIDWNKIQKRVWNEIDPDAKSIEEGNKESKNITVYKEEGKFIDDKTLKVGNEQITAKKIFICAGTRPTIPKIKGIEKIPYVTSDEVLGLKKQPKSMIIIGGGYIGMELGHFYSSIGTKVVSVNRGDKLLRREDEEISSAFTKIVSKKYNVMFNTNIIGVSKKDDKVEMEVEQNGKKKKLIAEVLLLATGRVPNTDILDVKKTNVKINEKGYVKVNGYMETNVKDIWAIGDIAGVYLFKHSANLEAAYVAFNAFNPNKKVKVNYLAMPHAIFTSPQIAGVGYKEQELKEKNIPYVKGRYDYINTGMGKAIEDKDGFVKVLVDPKTKTILGCHILGTEASTLIHEVIVSMKSKLGIKGINDAIHIHPALPEVVQRAFANINWN